ncbi:MAG TPA: chemotaxis protein CheW [Acidimicrobiales bacterium]|nr:chemotaxis protein CheW [Acidimicrobiales bacterium]
MSPEQNHAAGGDATAQYCTFKVDHLLIGIEVWRVQEVIRHQPMTHVPLAPKEVRGLINLRGQIVTAIDVRQWLGLPGRSDGASSMNVVLRLNDEAISLLVDEAGEVVEPAADTHEGVPSTASGQIRTMFSGTYKLDGALLLVLDTESVTRISGENGAGAAHSATRRAS